MSALDALGEYSSDGSAAASNLQVLSDYYQENIIDDDDCVMEAAEAALPAQQKIVSESRLSESRVRVAALRMGSASTYSSLMIIVCPPPFLTFCFDSEAYF